MKHDRCNNLRSFFVPQPSMQASQCTIPPPPPERAPYFDRNLVEAFFAFSFLSRFFRLSRFSLFSAFPSFPQFFKKQKPLRRREPLSYIIPWRSGSSSNCKAQWVSPIISTLENIFLVTGENCPGQFAATDL